MKKIIIKIRGGKTVDAPQIGRITLKGKPMKGLKAWCKKNKSPFKFKFGK